MRPIHPLVFAASLGVSVFLGRERVVAEITVEVGGAPMFPSKSILENTANSKDHSVFVAGVEATDLAELLRAEGPFTVFAPVDTAFEKLPKGTIDRHMTPESKESLTALLEYHVVRGKYSAADLVAAVEKGGGRAELTTLQGEALSVEQNGRKLVIIDAKGGKSVVTIPDVPERNGIVHVVDTVLLPKN